MSRYTGVRPGRCDWHAVIVELEADIHMYCRPDIYAIAFQEIVELTAQQIIQVDPAKRSVQQLCCCVP